MPTGPWPSAVSRFLQEAAGRPRADLRCFRGQVLDRGTTWILPRLRDDPAVLRLALLEHRQDRAGDEDRRVGPRDDADHQGEGEVLEGRAAEEEQATTGSSVIKLVLMDRVSVSQMDRFTMSPYRTRVMRGAFSRMRSKTMTVS